ncbi:sulphite efflux pump protein [Ephemerocybe angulata]|uniref:Sulphite efflux pump protein n=1 Tax=Ephemerocybe angulata TaxID=980116 RepID=A0A8H6MAN3_9AGAR|nr:sulphite efflux pump protein [Tulosesus angulatus]
MLGKRPSRWKRLKNVANILTLKANPVLFAVIMGTGSISNLFVAFPYGNHSRGMMIASLALFFLNLTLFCLFAAFSLAKYTLYPESWRSLTFNPVTSLFLGTFPMGITTLINVSVEVINRYFGVGGKDFLYFIWSIWWIDVFISVLCCWAGVHAMIVRQQHSMSTMGAAWLLPVVTLIVASSSGGVIANYLQEYSTGHALNTLVFSAFLVTVGLTLALMILTLYLGRLIIHGLPPGVGVLSVFLPLGPTGQAGYSIFLLGQNFKRILPYHNAGSSAFLGASATGEVLYVVCTCAAFILWSLATMWMLFALLALKSTVLKSTVAFKMSFWGLVFPNGVYANLTIVLGNAFDSRGLRIYGAAYAVVVICVWLSIAIRSILALKDLIDPHNQTTMLSEHPSAGTSETEIAIERGEHHA